MSRDIFVQDIPPAAQSVHDIADDWIPSSLAVTRAQVIDTVLAVTPAADFSDPAWGHVEGPGYDIEVNLGAEEVLTSFAFHVRAADTKAAERIVADVLSRLGLRAFDPHSATGIFIAP